MAEKKSVKESVQEAQKEVKQDAEPIPYILRK